MESIDEVRRVYLRLCKDHHTDSQDAVLHQIDVALKSAKKYRGYCLNLSTLSLSNKTCFVLGKVFGSDHCFTEISLNDCMIPEEAIPSIIQGMTKNSKCRKLDLKGNNIRGTATESLGRMLKSNTTLLSLCLEWNAMGMLERSFSAFCEGLTCNKTLQILDLRNNQISHEGTEELTNALKHNTTLKKLDLRWNNVGLLGGRALLAALDYNHTLVQLELAGNNTPTDVLHAIETAVRHNRDRTDLVTDYNTRTDMLNKEVQRSKQHRQQEINELMTQMENQEGLIQSTVRDSSQRIKLLQDSLQERKNQFDSLAAKTAVVESELVLAESKREELSSVLSQMRAEIQLSTDRHATELRREREERSLLEAKMNKELISLSEKNMKLQNLADDFERKCRAQQDSVYDLKEQLTHSQADLKLKCSQHEERLAFEKQKAKDAYHDAEVIKHREIERIRRDAEEVENSLKERINQLENQRLDLEQEVSQQKNNIAAERLVGEEQVMNVKQRLKAEEELRVKQLDDRVRHLQTSLDEAASHESHQSAAITDLQGKNYSLSMDNQQLKRRVEDTQQELTGRAHHVSEEVNKVRLELMNRIDKLEAERKTKAELYDKVSSLEAQITDMENKHKSALDDKERQISVLTNTIQLRETDLQHMKEYDQQRTSLLQTALQSYKSPFTS